MLLKSQLTQLQITVEGQVREINERSSSQRSKKGEVHNFGEHVTLGTRNRANKSESKRSGAILDNGATITILKNKSDGSEGSYQSGSRETVELAAGSSHTKFLCTGTVPTVHVNQRNETLISVGQVCDFRKTVIFTPKEAVIADMSRFTIDLDKIIQVIERNKHSGLYELSPKSSLRKYLTSSLPTNINLWHHRLAHANVKALNVYMRQLLNSLNAKET